MNNILVWRTGSPSRRRNSLYLCLVILVGPFGRLEPSLAEKHSLVHLRRRRTTEDYNNPYWDIPWRSSGGSSGVGNKQPPQAPEEPPAGTNFPYSNWASVSVSTPGDDEEEDDGDSPRDSDADPSRPFPVSHWASVQVISEKNVSSTTSGITNTTVVGNEDYNLHASNRPQDLFVDQCLTLLEGYSLDGQMDRTSYVQFLMTLSHNSLHAKNFQDLPLFLSMIFFSASCTSGEDCVTQEPAILVHPRGSPENQLNDLLCLQLMRFPFLEIALPFQFLIRVANGVSASEVLSVNETNQIVTTLELALDQVLLQGFNCSFSEDQPPRRVKPDPKRRQPQPHNACDYAVEVAVEDAADYPCGFTSNCILIFSDVSVYAVLSESLDEPKLRSLTTDVLRDAINGDALGQYLA
ncbi:expressed unknown protein [Seminavis robusta]|uniref:Uncharacterized protein n=1 Tax=Seminavis robusta TaxID=568900 RepID=A0A9N8H9Z9_9STRA|nr:expressed unknown protein [Seminavis robusta]|eukprot:Sro299_g111400.1 n/a (408) ;mRNA; f:44769-46085